jgi:predicted ester cyclase
MGTNAGDVVLAYVEALNREDFRSARDYVRGDLAFDGVLGSRRGSNDYFADMERMRLKYDVKKIFVEGDDVCLLMDVTLEGISVFTCAWYQVADGKIRSLRVVFDPRPLLKDKAA